MRESIILFGAGAAGRYALDFLRRDGIEPAAFADNDPAKWGTMINGVVVKQPSHCADASTWVATAISRPAATEIRGQLKAMGVKTKPLWQCLPVCHGLLPEGVQRTLGALLAESASFNEMRNQIEFRAHPDYDLQFDPSPISEIYFPDFITHLDSEHFVDVGAAGGDTVEAFLARWKKFGQVTAFEPDESNCAALVRSTDGLENIDVYRLAVSDMSGDQTFTANGDYSSHLDSVRSRDAHGGKATTIRCVKLDDFRFETPPTYIKMDIEGAELQALWGARRILKEHKPVLAICAYHTSDHLWEIPLLIHAIQPDYRLYLRRYAEGAFELVWYAVPPERVCRA